MATDDLAAASDHALAALGWNRGPGGELAIDGVGVAQLAAEFGTPLYVFCAATLARRIGAVQDALGPRVELLYSIKSNPSLALTARLLRHGAGAEIASLGELRLAIAAGHDPATLRFAGPGKTVAEITRAIELGLGCFHLESADELATIAAAAAGRDRRVGVAVRVNLPGELAGSRLRMGGRSSRFGVDAEQVPALLGTIAGTEAVELRGLHVYGGTQCFEAAAFVRQATELVERAAEWERELGLRLDELDLGGGFGVATYVGDPEFDLDAAGRGVRALIAAHDRPGRRWFVELGRYLVATAGIYLTRVVRTKTSGGERHVVIDGGLHQCAMAAGAGTVLKRPPLLVHAGAVASAARQPVTVGGPLCTSADQLAAGVELPPLAAEDLLAVLHAGAYGRTYSPTAFLSHPSPAEVLVEDGKPTLVRRRADEAEVLRDQLP